MAHNQYRIPGMPSDTQSGDSSVAPRKKAAPYQVIKNAELRIYSYRETALAVNLQKKSWSRAANPFVAAQMEVHDLIEKESRHGGKMFGKSHRFWLDDKGGKVFENHVSDWYHVQPNPANPKEPIVLRYQVTPTEVFKLWQGIEYRPTIDELQRLIAAIHQYERTIRQQMYPLDDAIAELSELDADFEELHTNTHHLVA